MYLLPTFSVSHPAIEHLLNRVHHCDALDLLRALPDASVDMIFADPPYGSDNGGDDLAGSRARDGVKGGRAAGAIALIANDTREKWLALMPLWLREMHRVLKPVSVCCCCCGGGGTEPLFAQVANWLNDYHTFNHAIVWDKSKRGYGMGWHYRRNYEFIMVSHKKGGRLAWNEKRAAQPNVVYFMPPTNIYHPTTKPVEMVEWFILNHTRPNAIILDPFCGSGTTALAARNTGRQYICGDMMGEYADIARKRLAQPYTLRMFE